jgi:hypothetical protein
MYWTTRHTILDKLLHRTLKIDDKNREKNKKNTKTMGSTWVFRKDKHFLLNKWHMSYSV